MRNKKLVKLLESMKHSKDFPALETTVSTVTSHLRDKQKDTDGIVESIVSDFALTQRVLRLVNSPMYAPFAKNVSSVSKALSIIGSDALSHIVTSISLIPDKEPTDLSEFGELSKTLLASELARAVCPTDQIEAHATAALVYNLGPLVVDKFLSEEMQDINLLVSTGVEKDQAATRVLGLTLSQFGALVANDWKFPKDLVSIIDGTGDKELINVAQFSNLGAQCLYDGMDEQLAVLVSNLSGEGLNKYRLEAKIQEKICQRVGHKYKIKQMSDEQVLTALLCDLMESKPDLTTLAHRMFTTITSALNTSHCLLFLSSPSGEFRIIQSRNTGQDDVGTKFVVGAEFSPTVFHAVITKNIDVFIKDAEKLNSLYDLHRKLLPKVKSFIVLPIAPEGVSGLMYCDWETQIDLSTEQLGMLRKLRNLFLPFFPRVDKIVE